MSGWVATTIPIATRSAKFAKVSSLKGFPLYGIVCVHLRNAQACVQLRDRKYIHHCFSQLHRKLRDYLTIAHVHTTLHIILK